MMRLSSATICFFLLFINYFAVNAAKNPSSVPYDSIQWVKQNALPPAPGTTVQPGLAGAIIGISNNRLILAGGANFPQAMPWEGGKKITHSQVYIAEKNEAGKLTWIETSAQLPYPIAYSANVTVPDGIISVGGQNNQGLLANVSKWEWNQDKQVLEQTKLPDLPKPLANAAAAVYHNKLYVIGGETEEGPTKAVWVLDLAQTDKGWIKAPALPKPTSHGVAVVQADGEGEQLFFIGGRAAQSSGISELYNQVLSLDEAGKKWIAKSPVSVDGETLPALSATSAVASGSTYILVFGGDDGQIFHQIETLLKKIKEAGSQAERDSLLAQKNQLVLNHSGFIRTVFLYNTITDTWSRLNDMPYAPVTTSAVRWGNNIIIPNGEIHPGVRTPEVLVSQHNAPSKMGWLDYAVIAVYLLLMVGIGIWSGQSQTTTDDYFKGGQKIPGWAAGLSIYGTQLSAITFMSIPAKTYATDWLYFVLQLTIIMVIPIITRYFIPFYRKLNITSAYEYLEKRFNYAVRAMGSLLYVMLQMGRLAIVLLLPSLALTVVTGISVNTCILVMGLITIFYTMKGGITAVIWTDVAQVIILLGGALVCLVMMLLYIEQPLPEVWDQLQQAGKVQIFDTVFRFDSPTLWVVLIGGIAINVISYGTDQSVVQKYLTTKNAEASKKSMRLGAWMALPSALIFFTIGTLLYVFYAQYPNRVNYHVQSQDAIFPWFIVSELPAGVIGLLIAAVFAAAMSTMSSSINSMTTAISTDFYRRFATSHSEKHYLNLAKIISLVIGILGTGLALVMAKWGITSLWDQFNMILGLFTGGLGGVFLLGIFTTRANGSGAVIGLLISAALQWIIKDFTDIHFLLYAATGLVTCVVFGYLFSLLFPAPDDVIKPLTVYDK